MTQQIPFKHYAMGPKTQEKTLNKICHEGLSAFKQEVTEI